VTDAVARMPVLAARRGPRMTNRSRALLAVAAVLLLAGSVTAFTVLAPHERASGFIAHHGCSEIPVRTMPELVALPYGTVTSCHALTRRAFWSGRVDASAYLLLHTAQGSVIVRVDYQDIGSPRWQAYATEVQPSVVENYLSGVQLVDLRRAIEARGGLRPGLWTLRLATLTS